LRRRGRRWSITHAHAFLEACNLGILARVIQLARQMRLGHAICLSRTLIIVLRKKGGRNVCQSFRFRFRILLFVVIVRDTEVFAIRFFVILLALVGAVIDERFARPGSFSALLLAGRVTLGALGGTRSGSFAAGLARGLGGATGGFRCRSVVCGRSASSSTSGFGRGKGGRG
jgi:hypothetical protein